MSSPDQALTSTTVVTGKLPRVRKAHAKRFVDRPPVAPEPFRQPSRLAIMLALAHKIQQASIEALSVIVRRWRGGLG